MGGPHLQGAGAYKGGPENVVKEALQISELRKTLDDIPTNPNHTKRLSPEVHHSIRLQTIEVADHGLMSRAA